MNVIVSSPEANVEEVISLMKENDISQVPVLKDGHLVGIVNESLLESC